MKIHKAILIILFLSKTLTASGGAWYDGDTIAPDRPHQKAKEGFGVQLLLTTDDSFFRKWASPEPPRLSIARQAGRGDTIYTILLYFGAGKDHSGHSNVTYDAIVKDPEGEKIRDFNAVRVISGPNHAEGFNIGLSEGYATIRFSDGSDKGIYIVKVIVTDHIKHVSLELEQQIELQ